MTKKKNESLNNYVQIGRGNMDYGYGRGNGNGNYPITGIGGGPGDVYSDNTVIPENDENPDNNRVPEI